VSLYGLIADPAQIQEQVNSLSGLMPGEVLSIISSQLTRISSQSGGALSVGLAVSILFALWSASAAVKALMSALNIIHNEREKRGFIALTAFSVGMTFGGVLMAVIAGTLVVGFPGVTNLVRWPILAALALVEIAIVFNFGPSRVRHGLRWVSWGGALTLAVWLGSSGFFSWYVAGFGKYNETYGSLAAIVILLLWLYISAFAVLLGAELNVAIEHRTDSGQGGRRAA
jgi:membrane protein